MTTSQTDIPLENLCVRTYQPTDQSAVSRLYMEGLLAGQIADNDTGADVENIAEAYFDTEKNHFWVAEVNGKVVGMIGVAQESDHKAEIRRLRVDTDWQHTPIASRLVETALSHCQQYEFLKIVLDTRFHEDQAMDLFQRFGFQHTRTREALGKDLLEFYLDLYREPRTDDNPGNRPDPN